MTTFVDFTTRIAKFNKSGLKCDILIMQRRSFIMRNEKKSAKSLRKGIKHCLNIALKTNANSTGCFVVYQPKTPKALNTFKKIK